MNPTSLGIPELASDAATLDWAADDFGHLVHQRPAAVARVRSAHDVVAITRYAKENGLPLAARGEGHSIAGQAQAPDGIVIDMSGLHEVEVRPDRVVIGAGARWSTLLAATLPHGLTPPVLTDYLELSIGGTLSVGGLGGASHHFGPQTDNVLELDVVTPDGELRTCSPAVESELFDAVRGGRGRHGIIIRATIPLIPAPQRAQRHKLFYNDLAVFLADQRRLMHERRFGYLEGQAVPDEAGGWRYLLEAVAFDEPSRLDDLAPDEAEVEELAYFDFLNRLAPAEEFLRAIGDWARPHPWSDVFLPDSVAEDLLTEVMGTLRREDVGENGVILIYPVPVGRFTTPLLQVPNEPVAFLFSLLRTASDIEAVRNMTAHNQALHVEVLANGGTMYLG